MVVPLIFFHFGVTIILVLVISCGGQASVTDDVGYNDVNFYSEAIDDNGLVVTLTKLKGDVSGYGLYGLDPKVGPQRHDFILSAISASTSVPMPSCNPKPTFISLGIKGETTSFNRYELSYSPGNMITPIKCPVTTTTTIAPTKTTTVPSIITIPTKTTATATAPTKTNTTTTLHTNTIVTTTVDFGIEKGKNQTKEDDGDKCHSRIRVVVAGLVFVFIIFNIFCNDFLETH